MSRREPYYTSGSLYVAAALIWGTTWFAITFQIAAVAPEFGVALRFALAAGLILLWCLARRIALNFSTREHGWFALQGAMTYSVAYVLIYYAERFIVSGLVAVGYAAAPLINLALARGFFGAPITARVAIGGALGIAGIVLVFLPEFAALSAPRGVSADASDAAIAIGSALTASAVLLSCLGNMIAVRQHRIGIEGWPPIGFSMLYGAAIALVIALILGRPLDIIWSAAFVSSLLYLTIVGSIFAFGAYFALLKRVGAARAAYVGVMVPIVALVISSAFEHFDWQPLTWAGVALAVAGNVLALRPAADGLAARPGATGDSA